MNGWTRVLLVVVSISGWPAGVPGQADLKQQVRSTERAFADSCPCLVPFSWEPENVEVVGAGNLAMSSGPVRGPVRDPSGKTKGDVQFSLASRAGREMENRPG